MIWLLQVISLSFLFVLFFKKIKMPYPNLKAGEKRIRKKKPSIASKGLMSPNICCVRVMEWMKHEPSFTILYSLSVCCMNSRTLHWQRGVSITGPPEKSLALHFYNLHGPLASETVPHGPFRAFRTMQYFLDLMHYNVFNSSLFRTVDKPSISLSRDYLCLKSSSTL